MSESTEDLERPAKRWEIREVSKSVEVMGEKLNTQDKKLDNISLKADRIIDNQVTPQHVNEKITAAKNDLRNEMNLMKAKYDPLVDNVKWVIRILVAAIIAQVISSIANFWGK